MIRADRNGTGLQVKIDVAGDGARRDAVWIAVDGELDLATADELATVLSAQLGDGHQVVCVDLTGLTFCDAAGLNTFLAAHHAYQNADSALILTGCSRRLMQLLRITGLDRELRTEPAGPYPPEE